MYQYEKSRKAQLHEKSFSWFWGIGGCKTSGGRLFCTDRSGTETYTNKLKRHFVRTNALLANFVPNSVQNWQAMPMWPQVAQRRLVGARPKPVSSGQHGPKYLRRFAPCFHNLNAPFPAFCPARCSPAEYQYLP